MKTKFNINNVIQRKISLIAIMICCLYSIQPYAQNNKVEAISKDSAKAESNQKDIVDIYCHTFHKERKDNAETKHKPWKFHFANVPAIGYTLQTGWAALVASNVGFYTTADTNAKLSNMLGSVAYSQYNQTILPFQANIWTAKNKFNIIVDWRYMDYPSSTFGLGGHTLLSNGYTIDFSYAKLHQSVVKEVAKNFLAGVGFFYDYLWNVKEINPPSGVLTSFEKYDNIGSQVKDKSVSAGFILRGQYDSRKNQINAKNGWYASAVFRPNFTWLGSDNNWASFQLDVRKYIPLTSDAKNVLALWNLDWLTPSGKPPYLLLPSTGWDDYFNTGRGYIQGRYRGKQFIYNEAEYRFQITNNGILGGVIFANAQSFSSQLSNQFKVVEIGYGAGIRFKLNKLSGANLCVDYGFGTDGSRGFFVNLGEVF